MSELSDAAIHHIREIIKEGTGRNSTFVDDDVSAVVGLAQRAVLAGLHVDITDQKTRERFEAAAERCREDHEKELGFSISKAM